MKWHKIKKCLPPEGEVVLIHVYGYKYAVGQLSSYGAKMVWNLVSCRGMMAMSF